MQEDEVGCAHPGCTRSFKNHRWGKTKAHDEGWFMRRDDSEAFCPDHLPEWVVGWRAQQKKKG